MRITVEGLAFEAGRAIVLATHPQITYVAQRPAHACL